MKTSSEKPFVVHGKYACFYGESFSQWYKRDFVVNGITYNCAEQAMMHAKAILFKDKEIADRIMAVTSPKEQKRLGRMVRNFDADVWRQKAYDIVLINNAEKFRQNPDLLELLFSTKDLTLVECSPYDTVWGIGRGLDWPHLADYSTWRGTNWLGEALTSAKQYLKEN